MKKEAWGGTTVLTPRGIEEYEATFTNLSPNHFIFNLRDFDGHIEMRVQRINVTGTKEQVLTLPKYPVNGLHFGTCTCRADKTNALPCEHMAAIALSLVILLMSCQCGGRGSSGDCSFRWICILMLTSQ
jgi:hypothetical protein